MCRSSIVCLFVVFFSCSYVLYAQHPYYYQLKDNEGVIGSELYSIMQDDDGYIWLGGNEGVFRYDGKQVKQYTCSNQNGKSISFLKKDKLGRIWCKNFNGQIFCVSGDSLKIVIDISKEYPTHPEFTVNETGILYSIVGGIAELNIQTGKTKTLYLSGEKNKSLLSDILIARDGKAYMLFFGSGLFTFKNGSIKRLDRTNNSALAARIIYNRGAMFLWGNRLMLLSEINPERKYYLSEIRNDSLVVLTQFDNTIANRRIFSCSPMADNTLWVGTQGGAICLDSTLKPMYNGMHFFPGSDVSNVMKDSEGNYWFTTLNNGIYIVPNIQIWQYSKQHNSLSDDNVTSLFVKEDNSIIVGYFNGDVDVLHGAKIYKPLPRDKAASMVRKILPSLDGKGYLIAHGITTYYNNQKGSNIGLSLGGIRDFCFTDNNKILFATTHNAGYFRFNNGKADSLNIFKQKSGRYVAYTATDKLKWIGYSDGTYYYDSLNREHELFFEGQKVFATAMKTDSRGHLWIGTVANGLMRVNDARVISHVSGLGRLNGNNVRAIYCRDSLVWVATEKGFNVINSLTDEVSYIDWHDGLPNMEIRQIYVKDNSVYLATNKGLITFPANIKTVNSIKPDIFITRVMVNDEEIPYQKLLNLNYDQNKIVIHFGTKGFTHKHQYSYSYLMKGLDTTWTESGYNTDYARFTSLPPGDYTFYVKAYNEDGYESGNMAQIRIHISKPFWSQWWFFACLGLITVGIVSLIFYLRIRVINKRNELEQGIRSSQLSALKAQMNPHFVYNALNSIQDLVLQNDIRNANIYFGKFSDLMRKVLDTSGKDKVSLKEEIDTLELYLQLEKLRFGDSFSYTVNAYGIPDLEETYIPAMIIQPFVENALKHGLLHKAGDKKLHIQFEQTGDGKELVCTITDNGIGRCAAEEINKKKAKMHKSFAVNATRKRLELLNKYYSSKIDLKIIDLGTTESSLGTMVVLRMPVDNA